MLELYKPIRLNNGKGIADVKRNIKSIFAKLPITDIAYIVALKDVAGDLDMVASVLRKRLNEKVSIEELKVN